MALHHREGADVDHDCVRGVDGRELLAFNLELAEFLIREKLAVGEEEFPYDTLVALREQLVKHDRDEELLFDGI